MNPEDDPRYLAEVAEFVPEGLTEAEVEEDLRYHAEIVAMFATKGWKHLNTMLEGTREEFVHRLVSFSGADTLDTIYGLRSAVSIIDQIVGQKQTAQDSVDRDKELLSKMREGT